MSDGSEKAADGGESHAKVSSPSKIGAVAFEKVSYRQWMIGKALEALLTRNGPYKEVAEHAVQSVDKVLKILDSESTGTEPKAG